MARRTCSLLSRGIGCLAAMVLLATACSAQWAEVLRRHGESVVTVTALIGTADPGVWRRHVGTGLVVAPGRVLTSSYVLADADDLYIEARDGRRFQAALVGGDGLSRLALLRTSDDVGPVLDLTACRNPALGEPIAVVGTAYGFSGKLSPGIVSGLDRTLMDEGLPAMSAAFEVSADAEPGMSGAPVFADDGALLWVVLISTLPEPGTTHSPLDGGGLVAYNLLLPESLPAERRSGPPVVVANPLVLCAEGETLRYVSDQLLASNEVRWGRVGLSVGPTPTDLVDHYGLEDAAGAVVLSLAEGGPAEAAGLRPGDVLLSVDGVALSSGAALMRRVLSRPGEALELEYLRQGVRGATTMILGAATVPLPGMPGQEAPPMWVGVSVAPVSESLTQQLGLQAEALSVVAVMSGSPAEVAGLRPGDVITLVDGEVATAETLRGQARGDAVIELTVLRRGQTTVVRIQPEAPPQGLTLLNAGAMGMFDF